MPKPLAVKYAERALWADLALSALLALVERQMNLMTSGLLAATLLVYLAYSGLLHKIGQGSNWARYTHAVLTVLGYAALLLGAVAEMPRIEIVFVCLTTPLTVLSVYWLFTKESSAWFEG